MLKMVVGLRQVLIVHCVSIKWMPSVAAHICILVSLHSLLSEYMYPTLNQPRRGQSTDNPS